MASEGRDEGRSAHGLRAILAVSAGNTLEWFEIVIFSYAAPAIARLFFPTGDTFASLLLVFATFGVTFIMRPFGAVALGHYADRHGRKAALQISILLMMVGSTAIGLVPDYQAIGIAAPIILVTARLIQGFALGGEFGSATAFLAEQSSRRRGFFASLQFASQGATALLATGFVIAIASILSPAQIDAWGWRIPFLFGLAIGPVGYYIRRNVDETEEFRAIDAKRFPLGAVLRQHGRSLLIAIGLVTLGTTTIYTMVFMPTYAVYQLKVDPLNMITAGMIACGFHMLLIPTVAWIGAWSDKVGRTLFPTISAGIILLVSYPGFAWLAADPSVVKLIAIYGALDVLTATFVGAIPALMAELFPPDVRTTGLAISYSIGVALFGGFAPLIHTMLLIRTDNPSAPGLYVAFAAAISLAALIAARRAGHK